MKIENLILGPLANNVYLIDAPAGVVVVDPSCEVERIMQAIGERPAAAIVLTHAHWDHVGAAKALRDATGAPVVASAIDAPVVSGTQRYAPTDKFEPCPVDIMVEDGQDIELGGVPWHVMITPGHTHGSLCLYYAGGADAAGDGACTAGGADGAGDAAGDGAGSEDGAAVAQGEGGNARPVLISGDTLFRGTHGRTDFNGGSPEAMKASLQRLAQLPDETVVLPGHNEFTTIGAERAWMV